jgi:hypothetical protein
MWCDERWQIIVGGRDHSTRFKDLFFLGFESLFQFRCLVLELISRGQRDGRWKEITGVQYTKKEARRCYVMDVMTSSEDMEKGLRWEIYIEKTRWRETTAPGNILAVELLWGAVVDLPLLCFCSRCALSVVRLAHARLRLRRHHFQYSCCDRPSSFVRAGVDETEERREGEERGEKRGERREKREERREEREERREKRGERREKREERGKLAKREEREERGEGMRGERRAQERADVMMWWCDDVMMWWCDDVMMWWCDDVMMWWVMGDMWWVICAGCLVMGDGWWVKG